MIAAMAAPMDRPAGQGTLAAAVLQMSAVAALIGVSVLLAAHSATLARLLFVGGAVAITGCYFRRSPWQYLTATLWFWTISPFARRLIDFSGGFEFANIVLITPNLLTLFMLKPILTSRRLPTREGIGIGLLMLAPAIYGLAVSFFKGEVMPGVIAAADWFPPLLYYFYFVELAPRIREAEDHFRHFIALNMLVVSAYGLNQYFNPSIWDVRWVLDTHMTSVGPPIPYGMKPFSTLNGPGVCAAWLAALLLMSLHFRNRLSIFLLPGTALLLAVTLVRATIGGTIVALSIALLLGRGRMVRSIGLVIVAAISITAIVPLVDRKMEVALESRLSSVNDIGNDGSALARAELYRSAPGLIETVPLGLGIGALGRGAEATSSDALINVDSGPVAVYLALGWIPGTFYFVGIVGMAATALVAARRCGSPAALTMAVVAAGGAATFLFGNLIGLQGTIICLCAGYAVALGGEARWRSAAHGDAGGHRSA